MRHADACAVQQPHGYAMHATGRRRRERPVTLSMLGTATMSEVLEHSVKTVPLMDAFRTASSACCGGANRLTDTVYIWDVLVVLADRLPCMHGKV